MESSPQQQQLLIDVRTPAEYSTGHLSLDDANSASSALNIEYQVIDQLPVMALAVGIIVQKSDSITLYCRSGRRSNVALQVLRGLGYGNVRDIGGLEEAGALLRREALLRAVGGEEEEEEGGGKRGAREKAFGVLMEGLRELE